MKLVLSKRMILIVMFALIAPGPLEAFAEEGVKPSASADLTCFDNTMQKLNSSFRRRTDDLDA